MCSQRQLKRKWSPWMADTKWLLRVADLVDANKDGISNMRGNPRNWLENCIMTPRRWKEKFTPMKNTMRHFEYSHTKLNVTNGLIWRRKRMNGRMRKMMMMAFLPSKIGQTHQPPATRQRNFNHTHQKCNQLSRARLLSRSPTTIILCNEKIFLLNLNICFATTRQLWNTCRTQ